MKEELFQIQGRVEEFVNGVKYLINFTDFRWLQTPKREGVDFLRLAKARQDREHTFNTTSGLKPTTWDPKATNVYYRTRPVARDMDARVARMNFYYKIIRVRFDGFET